MFDEGFAIGLAEVRAKRKAEGEAKGIAKSVKSMLRAGFDENKISNILGLSLDEISRLRG